MGEKELFKGLKIESTNYNFNETYPVLMLSMNIHSSTPEQIEKSLFSIFYFKFRS
jgi:hypothetical protein